MFHRALVTIAIALVMLSAAADGQSPDRTEAAARELLQQYSAALASLDAEAVKKVQPSIDVETLRKAFREMKTLDVSIDAIKVLSSEASVARVSCRVTQTLTPKAGSKRSTAVTRVLRLRRLDAAWVIDSFER
jgi:hypothetical protein